MADKATAVSRDGSRRSRLKTPPRAADVNLTNKSLVDLCRNVIVANLERYPPEVFGVCAEDEFEAIIRLRHQKTQPKEGSGGLDGTGRVAPTVSDRFMTQVEASNPHLAESTLVDVLVWKDCVEYKFRRGGLTRPQALLLPWPLLVERIKTAACVVVEPSAAAESHDVEEAIGLLEQSDMNVALLQSTGVGKTVKKALKTYKDDKSTERHKRLDQLLNSWKAMAAETMGTSPEQTNTSSPLHDESEDLHTAESCQTWRQLFCALQQREELRRSNQGKRMREIRKNLQSGRPKIVKVRPTSAKHACILARPMEKTMASKQPATNSKISKLRKESSIVAHRQRASPSKKSKTAASFGAAVAFATGPKRNSTNKSRSKASHIQLAGGKSMKVPTSSSVKGSGPRQLTGLKRKRRP